MTHALAFAFIGAVGIAPISAMAHGPAPAAVHGGQVQEAAEHWVELVLRGDQVSVFVSEPDNKPLAAKEWSGKAVILVGGKTETITLAPGDGNSAIGRLTAPASGRVTAVIQLTIDGKPAQARFAIAP